MQTREHLALGQELVLQDVDMPVLKRKRLQRIVNAELRVLDFIDSAHYILSTSDGCIAIWTERPSISTLR